MPSNPTTVLIGKSTDGRFVAEVTIDCPAFSQVIKAAQAFNAVSLPGFPECIASEDCANKMFFVFPDGASPQPLFGPLGDYKLTTEQCRQFANLLVQLSHHLNLVGLGLWSVKRELCFIANNCMMVVPCFWAPFLRAEMRFDEPGIPPELRSAADASPFSPPADVFAIASACYDALADTVPILPNPKLPGEWDTTLSSWDAALDAGLRVRPERRPSNAQEWLALLETGTRPAEPIGERLQDKPCSEAKGASPTRNTAKALLLSALIVILALVGWHYRTVIPTRPRDVKNILLPGYTRGFADSVIKYGTTSYTSAKWREIYNVNKLLPEKVQLLSLFGWDRRHFAIGSVGNNAHGGLLIRYNEGTWSVIQLPDGGNWINTGHYLSPDTIFVLAAPGQGGDDTLFRVKDNSTWNIGETRGSSSPGYSFFVPLAADQLWGFACISKRTWKYDGSRIVNINDRSREFYILTKGNIVAQCNGETTDLGGVTYVATVSPGRAVGLWSPRQSEKAAIISYSEGKWLFEQELPKSLNQLHSAWFLDEKNMVAVGRSQVLRVINGKAESQALVISGHEYSAAELVAVWGKSMDDYCVADRRGNIFRYSRGAWRLEARAPSEDNDRADFHFAWVSPEGVVFGLTLHSVYCLE